MLSNEVLFAKQPELIVFSDPSGGMMTEVSAGQLFKPLILCTLAGMVTLVRFLKLPPKPTPKYPLPIVML